MNYLSGAFRYVARGESESQNNVRRLTDRIRTSSLPQDRRSAIIQLTEAAKASPQRQVEVGELSLKVLYAVLEQDVDYDETIKAALELLIAICGTLDPSLKTDNASQDPAQQAKAINASIEFEQASATAAATNVDVFLGLPNALSLLLQLLEKGDFYVKFETIELLTAMAANSRQTLQMALLEAAQGVTRICDLLDDTHRHIRSNAVLLLSTLCDRSSEICKIIAFGGVLEKLFGLIDAVMTNSGGVANVSQDENDEEDSLEAAIVVQDVLLVVRNLIIGTKTTKTFFRDTGCLQRLVAVIQRAAADANMVHGQGDIQTGEDKAVGLTKAIQRQAKKNLIIAMTCITGLVTGSDEESKLVKNDLCGTKILQTLGHVAFFRVPDATEAPQEYENVLSSRVSALRTISALVRDHEGLRQAFGSESCGDELRSESTSMQVATMNAMLRDPSAAIRLAAHTTLRDSFVVDEGLDLPSSALLNALVGTAGPEVYSLAENRNVSHPSIGPRNDVMSTNGPTTFIAATLKEALVGWPSATDAAGVFYAASIVSWVLSGVQGAREGLLSAQVNGIALLPQIIRVLGKLERERGAAEARISLFTLVCVWLYRSSTAVSAFLSSPMHLPMLVDILKSSGSRGDIAEVHTRGLSAVLLGICLQAADGAQDAGTDSGVLSGRTGPAAVIPPGVIADVIRNRIGVTMFTSCLDDLRATKAFSATDITASPWKSTEALIPLEERNGFLCFSGSVGHENWYTGSTKDLLNNVYKSVGEKALDLVADAKHRAVPFANDGAQTFAMNGHTDMSGSPAVQKALLADSERDEVITSYKEFIRIQDESLNSAKSQIEDLTAALQEAQQELDKTSGSASLSRDSEQFMQAKQERDELLAHKEALQTLLEEKTADFEALSNAFAALEADQAASSQVVDTEYSEEMAADVQRLRSQNESLKNSLESEIQKNEDLTKRANLLDDSVKSKDVELNALAIERDSMKTKLHPEVVEALQWRTRADVAESKIRSRQELIDSYQNSNTALQDQLREIERTRDEALASISSLTKRFNSTKSELESLRATRRIELEVSREASSASDASAMNEIASLKEQLAEARQQLQNEIASKAKGPTPAELNGFEHMRSEYQAVVNAYEKMKTELMDSKQAVAQWQKRAETSEAARQREGVEGNRVADHARSLEGQLKALNNALLIQTQTSEASTTRVSELEQQCKEIDEIRKHTEEELVTLKEQLASRTEQSIRLSGQLYEIEESKAKLEEEIETLRTSESSGRETRAEKPEQLQSRDAVNAEEVEELRRKLAGLQEELEVTKNALADSKDRESLSQAHASDRDAMVAKVESLLEELSNNRTEKERLEGDASALKERLLSLDEAEEAKKALTMQVVSLQESVAVMKRQGISPTQGVSTDRGGKEKALEAEVERLRTLSDEKSMRLEGLESSLSLALDRAETAEREKKDMEKQVAETDVMFSVLQSDRNGLMKEREELQRKVEELSPLAEDDTQRLEELQKKLTDAEKMRDAVSQELASLVAACQVSERESKQLKDDSIKLNESLINAQNELSVLQNGCKDTALSRNVDDVVNTMLMHASLTTQASVAGRVIENLRAERDKAVAARAASQSELQSALSEMAKLPALVKERDAAIGRHEEQSNRIAVLSEELVGLQLIANERDKLASLLDAAEGNIDDLIHRNAAALTALEEANAPGKDVKDSSSEDMSGRAGPSDGVTIQRRVEELEEALRDAARTVTATNGELIAAQSLLVDLSADKTTMRTELNSAQEQINELVKQVANLSRSSQAVPALSEVSEQEHSFSDDRSVSPASIAEEAAEGTSRVSQAEASNLRTALERSMTEADSAAHLVSNIEARIAEIETRLKESQVSANSSQRSAEALNAEVERLRKSHQKEKDSLERDADQYKARIRQLECEIEQTKEIWKETLSISEESWSAEREKLENELTDLRRKLKISTEERSNLQEKIELIVGQLEVAKESAGELKESKQRLSSSLKAVEEERSYLKELVEKSDQAQKNLNHSLRETKADLQSAKDSFETERKRLEQQHRVAVKDLEDELDRASSAMEITERAFRDSEATLKEQIIQGTSNLRDLEQKQKRTQESLRSVQADVQRICCEKEEAEANLTEIMRQKEFEISALETEKNEAKSSVVRVREHSDNLRRIVQEREATLKKTTRDLKEECERRAMLESENQDLLLTIESLESTSKRTRSELSQKTKDLQKTEGQLLEVQSGLQEKTGRVDEMERVMADKDGVIRNITEAKINLENLKNELDVNLKNTKEMRDSLAQDNKDLLAWVSDLEKRALELQSAASDFQEVEQNLRDALESQRYASEQNSKLVEELRKEKAALLTTQSRVVQVVREKEAAEAERDSSQRRAQEIEARIREIREKNLVKFSHSEEAIRAKAKQCAELETALAAAERKVAELESVSDDLFGATTSLKQLDDDMKTLKDRALSAEETADVLRKKLQAAQAEVSEVRENSSGDALRSLEVEHNELLVYLADLELEVTNLKEELGRE